ncbi:MAG TPA: c-type cytochrome [Pseudomonadales bacterium]
MRPFLPLLIAGLLLTGCDGTGAGSSHPGENTYNRSCFSCHAGGVGGAPVPGDAEAWAPRIAKGRDALVSSVRDGIPPGMPPMGMCMTCSDEDLAAAVDYMLAQ